MTLDAGQVRATGGRAHSPATRHHDPDILAALDLVVAAESCDQVAMDLVTRFTPPGALTGGLLALVQVLAVHAYDSIDVFVAAMRATAAVTQLKQLDDDPITSQSVTPWRGRGRG